MCGLERAVELPLLQGVCSLTPSEERLNFPTHKEKNTHEWTETVMLSGVPPIGRVPVTVSHLYLNEAGDW